LDNGADIQGRNKDEDKIPFRIATEAGNIEMMSLLLERGASIEALNYSGVSPLMIAAEKGDGEVVTFLIQHGANPRLRSRYGQSAQFYASCRGHHELADYLKHLPN
jgi:ankyrin repeat protein